MYCAEGWYGPDFPWGMGVYERRDVAATLDRLVSLGAKQLEALTEQGGTGKVTALVIDPFGNVLGIHYLDILGDRGGAQ